MAGEAGDPRGGKGGVWLWAAAYAVATVIVVVLTVTHAVSALLGFVLLMAAMAFLVAMVRAAEKRQAACGALSPAGLRYNRRFLIAGFAYMAGLGIAIFLHTRLELSTGVTFALAVLPTLAIFGMIWVMGRYLAEETDEYLRHRAIMAALGGLALVLGLGSFWGFLETFGLVEHVPGWASVPVFAIGMALTQLWMKVRGA
jgi:Ca2+/Na+ antiporter